MGRSDDGEGVAGIGRSGVIMMPRQGEIQGLTRHVIKPGGFLEVKSQGAFGKRLAGDQTNPVFGHDGTPCVVKSVKKKSVFY
ncbi:hypothetical protein D3C85_1567670 [compost metagenome]